MTNLPRQMKKVIQRQGWAFEEWGYEDSPVCIMGAAGFAVSEAYDLLTGVNLENYGEDESYAQLFNAVIDGHKLTEFVAKDTAREIEAAIKMIYQIARELYPERCPSITSPSLHHLKTPLARITYALVSFNDYDNGEDESSSFEKDIVRVLEEAARRLETQQRQEKLVRASHQEPE